MSLKYWITLLIFCVLDLSFGVNGALKSPSIILLVATSRFMVVSICLIVFRSFCAGCIHICNCYISFLDWFLDHNIVSFFLSCCSLVAQSHPTICGSMDCSMPGFPVLHYLPELAWPPVHWINDAFQPSHLSFPSPPAFNLSQYQGLFQCVISLHQVIKVLEFRLQLHQQCFQWIFRVDFL